MADITLTVNVLLVDDVLDLAQTAANALTIASEHEPRSAFSSEPGSDARQRAALAHEAVDTLRNAASDAWLAR